jgi:hypothetical protein
MEESLGGAVVCDGVDPRLVLPSLTLGYIGVSFWSPLQPFSPHLCLSLDH